MRLVPRASTRIPSGASPKVRLFASPTTPARNLLERTRSSMGYLMECPFGGEPIRYRPSQTPARATTSATRPFSPTIPRV